MYHPNKRNLSSPRKSIDRLVYINNRVPGLVIPVGPRFQAIVPEWKGPPPRAEDGDLNASRWLGTRIWPPQLNIAPTLKEAKVGKGRPDSCSCSSRGSPQCVIKHISESRKRVQVELGPAYRSWKFDEMGEDVANSWTLKQRALFEYIVKTNPLSEGRGFLEVAEKSFRSKTRKNIINYYLNVHIPKRISMLTRLGCRVMHSDDEEVEDAPKVDNCLKRSRSNHADITQLVKSQYLGGRR